MLKPQLLRFNGTSSGTSFVPTSRYQGFGTRFSGGYLHFSRFGICSVPFWLQIRWNLKIWYWNLTCLESTLLKMFGSLGIFNTTSYCSGNFERHIKCTMTHIEHTLPEFLSNSLPTVVRSTQRHSIPSSRSHSNNSDIQSLIIHRDNSPTLYSSPINLLWKID